MGRLGKICPCPRGVCLMKLKILAALSLAPVVALVEWQLLFLFEWWWIVWLSIPLVGFVSMLGARIKRWQLGAVSGFVLLTSGSVGGVVALGLNRIQVADNRALGDQIAAALEKHWAAHASYPDSLSQLVPEFLGSIPTPSLGLCRSTPFWYTPSDREGSFVLGFQASAGLAVMRSGGGWSAVPLAVGPL